MPYAIQDITEWVYFVFFYFIFKDIVIDTVLLHINYGLEA